MLHSDPRFSHDELVKNAGKACKTQLLDRTHSPKLIGLLLLAAALM